MLVAHSNMSGDQPTTVSNESNIQSNIAYDNNNVELNVDTSALYNNLLQIQE